ncbi:MAG: hypothetical protein RIR76_1339 [Verrucomicrobiota bacterium]|jgi:hypothetical protein|nr:hypothetical protein [Opitutaceae bacterium]
MNPLPRILAAGLALATLPLEIQATPSARITAALTARGEAAAALVAGNPALALSTLRRAVGRGPHAPSEEAQLIATLCSLSREMEAASPGSGRIAAGLAFAEGKRPQPKLNPREAALADLALGELSEFTLGDHDAARAFYESALGVGATSAAARRGLNRITWRQALIETKAAESATLRRRNS